MKTLSLFLLAAACCALAPGARANPLGTAFTYQGRLSDGSAPANGNYDFRFILYDADVGGAQVPGTPIFQVSNIGVSNGLFTALIDFGATAFNGGACWLEIAVRTNANPPVAFITLGSRQIISPAPYALYAPAPAGGAGLTLSGGLLNVNFAGSGSANAAAHADHDHYGQSWTGAAGSGLMLATTANANNTSALKGQQGGAVAGPLTPAGVVGTSADGYGLFGISTRASDARGIFGWTPNLSGDSYGVYGQSDSTSGIGLYGANGSQSGSTIGVRGIAYSSDGVGGAFANPNAVAPGKGAAVRGVISGATYGDLHPGGVLNVPAAGEFAGRIGVIGASPTNSHGLGVLGISPDSDGYGIYGFASGPSGGVGVFGRTGSTSGAALVANAPSTGTALWLASGAIRVEGAGVGTDTPAFVHIATAANIEAGATHRTTITHALCDGDHFALLFVTPNYNPGAALGAGAIDNHPIGLFFNATLNKWQIFHQDFQPIAANAAFNVLVIKP